MVFWGHKTEAFLDVWSIEHVFMGIGAAALYMLLCEKKILKLEKDSVYHLVLFLLLLSFSWETLEHYLETGLAGARVENWFAGVEHWSNRMISDHLAVLAGAYIYLKCPLLLWPTRMLSAVYLIVHIFVFPHSMYLHNFM